MTLACEGSWGARGLALRLCYTVSQSIPAWDTQNTARSPPPPKKKKGSSERIGKKK